MTTHVSGGTVYTGPVGGGGPYTELGHTAEGNSYNVVWKDEPEFDFDALRRGFGGQTITATFTMTRRQMRHVQHFLLPKARNRRRNPLHGVRDRLRRVTRGRGRR